MKCSEERSVQLMEYAGGMLPPAEVAVLEAHLSECSYCREELVGWRRLEAQLQALPLVAEPAGFKATVMSQVAQPQRAPLVYRAVAPAAALSLGAALVGIGTILSLLSDARSLEWQFNAAYLAGLASDLLGTGLGAAGAAAGIVLTRLAAVVYSAVADSGPVLLAALLLAIFAIGPSEIAATLSPREMRSRG